MFTKGEVQYYIYIISIDQLNIISGPKVRYNANINFHYGPKLQSEFILCMCYVLCVCVHSQLGSSEQLIFTFSKISTGLSLYNALPGEIFAKHTQWQEHT